MRNSAKAQMMEPATRDLCLVLEVATLAKITVTQATRAIAEIAAVTRAEATAGGAA